MRKYGKLVWCTARLASWMLVVLACSIGCHSDGGAKSNSGAEGSGGSGGGKGGSGGGTADNGATGMGGAGSDAGGAAGESGCVTPPLDAQISVAGVYQDDYGTTHRVSDERWVYGDSPFEIADFSDDERWIVAQNSADDPFNPGLYSRFEWTFEANELFYCQSVFDAPTAADARSAERADGSDLSTGCAGFPWSRLTAIELVGSYDDDFGGRHDITPALWESGWANFHLLAFSNEDDWAVYQNDCDNDYYPGLFSRFDWTTNDLGAAGAAGAGSTLYYCQTGFDAESEPAATKLSPADADDLEEGCNGFPWSALTPRE